MQPLIHEEVLKSSLLDALDEQIRLLAQYVVSSAGQEEAQYWLHQSMKAIGELQAPYQVIDFIKRQASHKFQWLMTATPSGKPLSEEILGVLQESVDQFISNNYPHAQEDELFPLRLKCRKLVLHFLENYTFGLGI
jgi:hypothetical protein